MKYATETPDFYKSDPLSKELGSKVSPREIEVADLIVAGLYNREIAIKLGISIKTVEQHVMHLRERSGVRNRVQLALWWSKQ